ncbi:MAG: hypothetical protein D6719_01085 [Candidatus Dadabacteria bacterium]|nr:MAG: hypothetical protein D6719_01085 [Candidatus Dadabacteria bacterium]
MFMRKIFILILFTAFIAACGSSTDSSDGVAMMSDDGSAPVAEPVVEERNVTREFFGQKGNLWKPAADGHSSGAGNLVVLFGSHHSKQFERCRVKKTDGTLADLLCINDQPWTQVPFSCFSNGNRQTWRATFPCSQVSQVRVSCLRGGNEWVFTVPDAQKGGVCSRFG